MALLGTVDLSGGKVLEGRKYMLPGEYTVAIQKMEAKETSTGKPQIEITFVNTQKEELKAFYMLDTSTEYLRDKLYTLIWAFGNNMETFDGNIRTELFMGKKADAIVKRKFNDYNGGKWYSQIVELKQHKNVLLHNLNEAEIAEMKNEKQQSKNSDDFGFGTDDPANEYANDFSTYDDFSMSENDLPF